MTGARTLQLHGAGGMGKTMHVRWLIARLCVPRGIACARIDFDAVVPIVALEEPWLVLLSLAEQLNTQLPRHPLTSLLTYDASNERARLYAATETTRVRGSDRSDEVRERLISQLPTERPVLLVLDTLEDALRRSGTSLGPLLDQLVMVHNQAPCVRLLFAGRFDLRERLPAHGRLFEGGRTLRLEGFTEQERVRYLRDIRHMDDESLVDAIARRSDESPLKLALIADIARSGRGLAADDLLAYEDADLMYLMKRVLTRIPEIGVRWALRYGALARVLDHDFFMNAVAPVVEQEMRGDGVDDPDKGLDREDAGTWRPGPFDPEAAWLDLRTYADDASWVEIPRGRGDAVRFHPDVLDPMRRLMREQPAAARRLHQAAAEYCARRARSDWARWTPETIYHGFQLDPERRSGGISPDPRHGAAAGPQGPRARADRRPARRRLPDPRARSRSTRRAAGRARPAPGATARACG